MAGLSPDESLAIAHDNARLTSTLRRVRRRVRRALTHAESATRLAEPSAELTGVVQELRAVLEDSAHVSEHPVPNNERGRDGRDRDGGREGEAEGRMSPPVGRVIDELRSHDN